MVLMNPLIVEAKTAANQNGTNFSNDWFSNLKTLPVRSQAVFNGNGTSNSNEGTVLSDEESKLILLINQERSHTGLPELKVDPVLVKIARAKSSDMVSQNYFGHISDKLGTVYDQLDKAKYQYKIVAENLIGAPNYSKANEKTMSSLPHRNNLLNPEITKIGIGIIRGGPFGEMITELFINQ
jgi:uncharacterized protein YkwD